MVLSNYTLCSKRVGLPCTAPLKASSAFLKGLLPACFLLLGLMGHGGIRDAAAEDGTSAEHAFLPTWKLLKSEAKQHFVAGYLYGWRDAEKVTDIAIDYVKENPQGAVEGLERVRGIYDMQGLTADSMVRELDAYFSESGSKDATLSQAITAVRGRLGR
jgi:hypothetical protein